MNHKLLILFGFFFLFSLPNILAIQTTYRTTGWHSNLPVPSEGWVQKYGMPPVIENGFKILTNGLLTPTDHSVTIHWYYDGQYVCSAYCPPNTHCSVWCENHTSYTTINGNWSWVKVGTANWDVVGNRGDFEAGYSPPVKIIVNGTGPFPCRNPLDYPATHWWAYKIDEPGYYEYCPGDYNVYAGHGAYRHVVIRITGDDVRLKCNGTKFIMQNDEDSIIRVEGRKNIEIEGCSFDANSHIIRGIKVTDANNVNVSNNNFYDFRVAGIEIKRSKNNNVQGCRVYGHSNSSGNGIELWDSNHNRLMNVTTKFHGERGIILLNSSYNTLINITTENNTWAGIQLEESSNYNNLTDITANFGNEAGIDFRTLSNYNILKDITTEYNNWDGIAIRNSSDNTLTGIKTKFNAQSGIRIEFGSDNIKVLDSEIFGSDWGILSFLSNGHNTFINNTIFSDSYGMILYDLIGDSYFRNNNITSTNRPSLLVYLAYDHDIDTSNYGNSKPIYYYNNVDNTVIDASGINTNILYVTESDNVTVRGVQFGSSPYQHFEVASCNNAIVEDVYANGSTYGIAFWDSTGDIYRAKIENVIANGIDMFAYDRNMVVNVWDSSISNSGMADVVVWSQTSNLINTTYNSSHRIISDGDLYRKWYFDGTVYIQETMHPVEARVRIKDALGQVEFEDTVSHIDAILTQYHESASSDLDKGYCIIYENCTIESTTFTNHTPHEIRAHKIEYKVYLDEQNVNFNILDYEILLDYFGPLILILLPIFIGAGLLLFTVKKVLEAEKTEIWVAIMIALIIGIALFGVLMATW